MPKKKRTPEAATEYKNKYTRQNYSRYSFVVRKDDPLNDDIKEFNALKDTSLNALVVKLLRQHFFEEG